MAQDFAKQRTSPEAGKRKRSASRPPQPGSANWSWFFSGLMTGVIVSIAAYLAVLKLEEGVALDALAAQTAQTAINPEDEPTYTYGFYDRLTNPDVAADAPNAAGTELPAATSATTPNAVDAASALPNSNTQTVATAPEEGAPRYLLQAGSFENKQGAESRRTSIILLNMNANVVEGVVGGRTLYSVQVGPFVGRRIAEDARAILSSNAIESIRLLVPQ